MQCMPAIQMGTEINLPEKFLGAKGQNFYGNNKYECIRVVENTMR